MSQKRKEIFEKYNSISRDLKENCENKGYRYVLYRGNNSAVIQRVMDKRPSWQQVSGSSSLFEFKWTPLASQIKFDYLNKHGTKSLVNHFEFHTSLSEKDQLFYNLCKQCEFNQTTSVWDIMPITFVVDFNTRQTMEFLFEKFQTVFTIMEKGKTNTSLAQINEQL